MNSDTRERRAPGAVRTWMRQRPFVGGLLVVASGIEMFFSGQLDLGNIKIQMGISGLQATIIPVVLILLGVLGVVMPQHRIFYGVITLALAVYALIGVNLGGFIAGTLLGAVGGVLVVAWMPRDERRARGRAARRAAADDDEPVTALGERGVASPTAGASAPVAAFASPDDGRPHAEPVLYVRRTMPEPPPFAPSPSASADVAPVGAADADGGATEPEGRRERTDSAPRRRLPPRSASEARHAMPGAGRAALAVGLVLAMGTALSLTATAPARAATASDAALCIPILMTCPPAGGTTSPSPTPTATTPPSGGLLPGIISAPLPDPTTLVPNPTGPGIVNPVPSAPAAPNAATPGPQWGPATNETNMVFTMPAAQLGGDSLNIQGLHSVGLVNVKLIDGSTATVIKMTADYVAIDGFYLDVKHDAGGPALLTIDKKMELKGNVQVYLDSATATLPGGLGLNLGANTPPPSSGLPTSLLRVTLGLVGVTADSIVHTGTHQALKG